MLKRDIAHLFDVLLCVKPFASTLSPIHSVAASGKTSKPTDEVCANRSAVLRDMRQLSGVQSLFGLGLFLDCGDLSPLCHNAAQP